MIHIYHGSDTFESYHQAVNKLKKLGGALTSDFVINCDEIDLETFIQKIEGVSLFSSLRIFFLKRLFSNSIIEKYITDNYETLKALDIVIWEDKKIKSSNKLLKLSSLSASLNFFEAPKNYKMENWIKSRALKYEIKLKNNEAQILLTQSNFNKWIIDQELQKIALAQGLGLQVDEIISNAENFDIWEFLENFSSRNVKKIYSSLNKLINTAEIQLIISMIRRELFLLTSVKLAQNENDLKTLGIHPFVLKKMRNKEKNFTYQELCAFTKSLLNLDYAIKNGEIDPKHGLILFLQLL
ncbi:MAG: hypothetical protein KatS3mg085_176 [Candidatus Dojkabacteria bacterium]|nr:MAG: hypothetical protein KatS3mg085_176 [Candidatus Dojkabacteria bacterium]